MVELVSKRSKNGVRHIKRNDGGGLGRIPGRGIGGGSNPKINEKEEDLFSTLLNFIKQERIRIALSEYSTSEFWLDSPDDSIVMKVVLDSSKGKILYDIYSTDDAEHLKVRDMKDIDRLVYSAEETRSWEVVEDVEDLRLILDEIEIWAQKNKFQLMEKEMI